MLKVNKFTCKSCGAETDRKSNNDSRHCIDRCIPCYEKWHKEEVKRRNAAKKSQMKDRMALKRKQREESSNEFSALVDNELESSMYKVHHGNAKGASKKQNKDRFDKLDKERELRAIDKEFS